MKRKIIFTVSTLALISLLNFIYYASPFGLLAKKHPLFTERISIILSQPILWVDPFNLIGIIILDPIFAPFLIILCVILYYLYGSFIKNTSALSEKKLDTEEVKNKIYNGSSRVDFFDNGSQQVKSGDGLFKKVILWSPLVIAIWISFVYVISSGPGEGMAGLVLLLPIIPVVFIFYPVYFIILSIRYLKEKGAMDRLDKIMFYILFTAFLIICFLIINKP